MAPVVYTKKSETHVKISYTHMYRIHLNHVVSQRNSGIWLLALKQRYWSSLKLQRWCVWNWGEKSYEKCTIIFAEHVKISYSHVQNTPQPCRQSTKLRNMTISIKTKVLIKFEASEMMCVELKGKNLRKVYHLPNMWNLISYSHVQNTPQPCRQSTKLRNMTISIKTKVLIKFEASEMMCVELRGKKLRKVYHNICRTCENLILTCTEYTSTMSPVNETQEYDY